MLLEVAGLSLRVPGEGAGGPVDVLRGVDVEVHAGELVGLVAEPGGGASDVLTCVARAEADDVRVRGRCAWTARTCGRWRTTTCGRTAATRSV
ncbi:hypothetical protein [Mumia flava]|uniref:hypothetical protein n=1 Tax=Mumia flava TaxID=1348852 RepID=UPI0012FD0485|nr:hypothetical protein [Mumia flava]